MLYVATEISASFWVMLPNVIFSVSRKELLFIFKHLLRAFREICSVYFMRFLKLDDALSYKLYLAALSSVLMCF